MNTSVSKFKLSSADCRVHEVRVGLQENQDHWRNNALVVDALQSLQTGVETSVDYQKNDLLLLLELPIVDLNNIGNGLVLPVRGLCLHRSLAITRMSVALGEMRWPLRCRESRDEAAGVLLNLGYPFSQSSGFSGQVTITPALRKVLRQTTPQHRTVALMLEIELANGQLLSHEIVVADDGAVSDAASDARDPVAPVEPHWDDSAGSRVFICMATYNPDKDSFRRQIDSILDQQHRNWHLLINDDCSNPEASQHIQAIAASDNRISFRCNSRNLGFYFNFESALNRVPKSTHFVALADQDDRWYPDKLDRLLASMGADTSLAYCDMRILNADGSVDSETYWRGRHNNYSDLDVLLIANTVTGAASLFRYELTETLLPFPARIGDAFHDHWIACAAFVRGPLEYVDAALYDYQQHEASVVGHCDFDTPTLAQRLKRLCATIVRPRFSTSFRKSFNHRRQSALAVHRFECRRLELIASNLLLRCPDMDASHARALNLYGRGIRSGLSLLSKHISIVKRGHSTNDAEIRLGLAYLVNAFENMRQGFRRIRYRRSGRSAQNLIAGQSR